MFLQEYENSRKQYKKCMEEKNEMKKVLDKLKEENEPMDCKVQEAIKAAKKVENEAKDIVLNWEYLLFVFCMEFMVV